MLPTSSSGEPQPGSSGTQSTTDRKPSQILSPPYPTYPLVLDPELRKHIQEQLVLLLHANKCLRADASFIPRGTCTLPHCPMLKKTLVHMSTCNEEQCTTPHCRTSRRILDHYKNCIERDCQVCYPIKGGDAYTVEN